jgi:hypothetical protein
MGPSPDAMVSRASFKRNGPRSGLSKEGSERRVFELGESGGGFLAERAGEGLDRDGEGDGGFLGVGVLGCCSDRVEDSGRISGREMLSGGASGGVLTETRPGMAVV